MLKETNTPTRPRIEPGSPDPESDALTIRPVRPRIFVLLLLFFDYFAVVVRLFFFFFFFVFFLGGGGWGVFVVVCVTLCFCCFVFSSCFVLFY